MFVREARNTSLCVGLRWGMLSKNRWKNKEVRNMKLKNLGVYALPDGREFVVEMFQGGKWRLFSRHVWTLAGHAGYQVNDDGYLVSHGKTLKWRVENLIDTGVREKYPKPNHVL